MIHFSITEAGTSTAV